MSFDEVYEQLTLPRYNALQRFWIKCPPTAVTLARYVGYEAPGSKKVEDVADEPADELDDEQMSQLALVFGLPIRQKK